MYTMIVTYADGTRKRVHYQMRLGAQAYRERTTAERSGTFRGRQVSGVVLIDCFGFEVDS